MQVKFLLNKSRLNWDLLSNTFSLVGTTVVTSGLGFVYWWLAARQFPTEAVGLASVAISTMSLLGTLSMLGLGTLLIGELPRQPDKQVAFVITALLVSGSVGLVAGLAFAFVGGGLVRELQPLFANWGNNLIFALGVSFTAITLVLDQALIGMLRGNVQLWRNGTFAAIKLFALGAVSLFFADKLGVTIYTTWLVGNLISLFLLAAAASFKGIKLQAYRPEWSLLRGMGRTALSHHMLNLALLTPNLLLPMVVTVLLSATTNAHFYVANMITTIVYMGPAALTTVLFAVGSSKMSVFTEKMRFTLRLSALIGLVANVFMIFAAEPILSIFGASYVQESNVTMRVLALGIFPVIIKDHFVALFRIQGQTGRAFGTVLLGAIFELTGASIGALSNGLVGLSIGFVIGMCLEAAIMGPVVFRAVKPSNRHTGEKILEDGELMLATEAEVSLTIPKN